jgi:hypothetical protein
MLGHRGCRLGISYPEISEMQARAVFEAAAKVQKAGIKVKPEIMIPLVGFKRELDNQVDIVHRVAAQVQKETGEKIKYLVGTMIEIPRGALTADEIAETAEFFSFGTNDLTQTCLGMSRDDMGSFLAKYTDEGIFKANPFASIDATGVGQLMKIAVERGRKTRKDIKLGICGEHGGDPHSVIFCHQVGRQVNEAFYREMGLDFDKDFAIYKRYCNMVSAALPAALARRGAAAAFRSALGCVAVSLLAALRLFPLRRLLLLLEALTALSAVQVGVPCDC